MSDLELDRPYRQNDRGAKVRLIQEWLCLNASRVQIDGAFGPATEFAVRQFQRYARLRQDGAVGPRTFAALIRPSGASARIPHGSLFLHRLGEADWTHTGIVLDSREGVFETIEGNTNDDGRREGYEVCHGYRGTQSMDYVRL